MKLYQTLAWHDPLHTAELLLQGEEHDFTFLHTSMESKDEVPRSILALHPLETLATNDWSKLQDKLSTGKRQETNAWFGTINYEARRESLLPFYARKQEYSLNNKTLNFTRYGLLLIWNHHQQKLFCYCEEADLADLTVEKITATSHKHKEHISNTAMPAINNISSNDSNDEYLKKVEAIIEGIHAGEMYQTNLTRKFYGHFAAKPPIFKTFRRLTQESPAPYSALIKQGQTYILSSSPELFLKCDADGHLLALPIKGSCPREKDEHADLKVRQTLLSSEKNRAENLMIVDLMRNDLSQSCEFGTVNTPELFRLTSYETIHHLSSLITGKLAEGKTALDAVENCFPPGSMTGAPKIKAMEWIDRLENAPRGIYSGAIGWFGGDGSCQLSVIIRTLLIQDTYFEFQVGGGIVADSDPVDEWQETLTKARGICNTLEIDSYLLRQL